MWYCVSISLPSFIISLRISFCCCLILFVLLVSLFPRVSSAYCFHLHRVSVCLIRGRGATGVALGPGPWGDRGRPVAPGSPCDPSGPHGGPRRRECGRGPHCLRRGGEHVWPPRGHACSLAGGPGPGAQGTLVMGAPREGPLGEGRRNPHGGLLPTPSVVGLHP